MLKKGLERESPLGLSLQHLHDIRNHRAFWEMWERWGWTKPDLDVLYVGSGAHLAPLVFLHGPTPLRKVTYTCTEVNPFSAMRMEALLTTMVRAGIYKNLSVEAGPVPGSRFAERWAMERGKDSGPSRSALEFTRWIVTASEEMAVPASFVARFRFQMGTTRAEVRLLVRVPDTRPESASYFNLSDLETADLVITHDWDHDPRGNLKVLLDFVEAYWAGSRAKPLAVMMEDLRKYPFPAELGFFNPVVVSDSGYGHQEYVFWSDGTKAEVEDGACLYSGGVILEPNTAYLSGLSRTDRNDFFNLALFGPDCFERLNVDVINGKRVAAPALLDLGVGYASRDVRGEDLEGRPEFFARLAEAALHLLKTNPPMPSTMRPLWCSACVRFEEALKRGRSVEPDALFAQAEKDLRQSPFMRFPKPKELLEKFLKDRSRFARLIHERKGACAKALEIMEKNRSLLQASCGASISSPGKGATLPR